MVTQAIKNWLRKLFSWWPWKQSTEMEHTQITSPFNKGTTQGAISRSTIDWGASQSQQGIVQRLSTIEEWPDRLVKPLSPPVTNELPETPLPPPLSSPLDKPRGDGINRVPTDTTADIFSSDLPSTSAPTPGSAPTAEQQLEFLHYLVKRGIVNEGFEEGKIPEQYRRDY